MGMARHLDATSSFLGYLGAALIVLGYFLNQKGWLRSEDWRFPAMNLLGSVLVIVSGSPAKPTAMPDPRPTMLHTIKLQVYSACKRIQHGWVNFSVP